MTSIYAACLALAAFCDVVGLLLIRSNPTTWPARMAVFVLIGLGIAMGTLGFFGYVHQDVDELDSL